MSFQLLPEEQKTVIVGDATTTAPWIITTFDTKFIKRLQKANAKLVSLDENTGRHVFEAPKNLIMLKTI